MEAAVNEVVSGVHASPAILDNAVLTNAVVAKRVLLSVLVGVVQLAPVIVDVYGNPAEPPVTM